MQEPSAATSSSSIHDEPSTPEGAPATPGPSSTTFNLNHTPSESSFLPAQAAVSSTPAARAQAASATNNSAFFTSQTSGADPSWSVLVESPLVRLDRELREFTRADPEPTSTTITTDVLSTPTRTPHVSTRVEPREPTTRHEIEDYEDETTIPANMSPPVMVPFARLQTLGRSPAKSAATNIRHALLRSALRDAGGGGREQQRQREW
jgi:hypothetical protein